MELVILNSAILTTTGMFQLQDISLQEAQMSFNPYSPGFSIYLEDDISILNSDVAKKDRENAMSKKIIISTSDSLGRGIDLKGLDTVVDLETRNSKSETVQVIGRVSRTGMTNVGTYIQLIDIAFETVKRNFETKMKYHFFDDHFTDMKVKEYF